MKPLDPLAAKKPTATQWARPLRAVSGRHGSGIAVTSISDADRRVSPAIIPVLGGQMPSARRTSDLECNVLQDRHAHAFSTTPDRPRRRLRASATCTAHAGNS
jgi:hypothetical protein